MPWRYLIGKNSVEKLYQVNEGKSRCKKKSGKNVLKNVMIFPDGQANIAGAAGRACLRPREDLGRVEERVCEGLSIKGTLSNEQRGLERRRGPQALRENPNIISARPLADLSPARIAKDLGRRITYAEALIIRACSQARYNVNDDDEVTNKAADDQSYSRILTISVHYKYKCFQFSGIELPQPPSYKLIK